MTLGHGVHRQRRVEQWDGQRQYPARVVSHRFRDEREEDTLSVSMQLQIGAQQKAAETVLDTCEDLSGDVKKFAESVEQHLKNVTGSAAVSVVDVTNHWAESFKVFHEDLQRYAQALVEVDKAAAENEKRVNKSFEDIANLIKSRMEG